MYVGVGFGFCTPNSSANLTMLLVPHWWAACVPCGVGMVSFFLFRLVTTLQRNWDDLNVTDELHVANIIISFGDFPVCVLVKHSSQWNDDIKGYHLAIGHL